MADTSGNILINKTLVKNLALGTYDDAVGTELKMGPQKVTVVGVIDDFYSNSLKEGVDNLVMLYREENFSTLSVKLNVTDDANGLQEAVGKIEKVWSATYPDFIFSYQFLDENIEAFYAQEERYAKLFQLFSLIFLMIGCLGLYGLITFVVNRKGKEVAIRKVLGATLANILLLFSKEYVRLIVLSFALAVPVTYYVVNKWLNSFQNHIELQWWYFVTPGLIVLGIAILVVAAKSLRAAAANPVDKLKYE
jgi:ABC-type antimicrobial peptide transport system permease subunit